MLSAAAMSGVLAGCVPVHRGTTASRQAAEPVVLRYGLDPAQPRTGHFRFYEIGSLADGDQTFLLEFDADIISTRDVGAQTLVMRLTPTNVVADLRRHWKKAPHEISEQSVGVLESTTLQFTVTDRGFVQDQTVPPGDVEVEAADLIEKARAAVRLGFIELPRSSVSTGDRWTIEEDASGESRDAKLLRLEYDAAAGTTARMKVTGRLRSDISEALTIESRASTNATFSIDHGWVRSIAHEIRGPIPGEGSFTIKVDVDWMFAGG